MSLPFTRAAVTAIDRFTQSIERFMDERKLVCEASVITLYGAECSDRATVYDEETERHLCESCARKKKRGEL